MIDAIGFDLGETLIHYGGLPLSWVSLYPEALAAMAAVYAVDPSAEMIEQGHAVLARYNTRLHPRRAEVASEYILGEIIEAWGVTGEAGMEAAEDAFFDFFRRGLTVYSDTRPALAALTAAGLKLGVLTDVPYGMGRRFILQDIAAFADLIAAVLTSTDIGKRKPSPEGFVALADSIGVSVRNMLYVGNEEKDIAGARAAGMPAVLIDRQGGGHDWGQMATVRALTDLMEIVR